MAKVSGVEPVSLLADQRSRINSALVTDVCFKDAIDLGLMREAKPHPVAGNSSRFQPDFETDYQRNQSGQSSSELELIAAQAGAGLL